MLYNIQNLNSNAWSKSGDNKGESHFVYGIYILSFSTQHRHKNNVLFQSNCTFYCYLFF